MLFFEIYFGDAAALCELTRYVEGMSFVYWVLLYGEGVLVLKFDDYSAREIFRFISNPC
jgi:hypothetical protein